MFYPSPIPQKPFTTRLPLRRRIVLVSRAKDGEGRVGVVVLSRPTKKKCQPVSIPYVTIKNTKKNISEQEVLVRRRLTPDLRI